jgi:hypothetical protein
VVGRESGVRSRKGEKKEGVDDTAAIDEEEKEVNPSVKLGGVLNMMYVDPGSRLAGLR